MFKAVSDSAAAADGGSLALFVERSDGMVEIFVINRSIASRGTASYKKVSSNLRALTPVDCTDIATALNALAAETPSVHPVAEFVDALRQQR
ncbi:conserved hypothetical protein [Bosea sp. 62]|uniref:hypothetical protein n=1 Tax=unclassified Bosea (in: a-proteobacteria) TaxID=2653178 RepID=UPI0012516534|nr:MULTISPECIES: hypothetical protein [unclassified Bosea (in: a-proteobacteria)]CAD5288312.1 conserved hypothetical protein [Bosea sp. 21B]CAD5290601.1 conserved hypothetical protein [Bosea sp. 46]CAD5300876.1 conserved hypothetical protein [Bosea sp. 7B]VVT60366.1 conserved hypothetical protein [Bosea sp. EC-HK365B]VXA97554.1 conserved hypothetical protein [Bosea sp. 62]